MGDQSRCDHAAKGKGQKLQTRNLPKRTTLWYRAVALAIRLAAEWVAFCGLSAATAPLCGTMVPVVATKRAHRWNASGSQFQSDQLVVISSIHGLGTDAVLPVLDDERMIF
eukprot:scaffold2069_cov187-Amphora_coffeaeformis.AAC.33